MITTEHARELAEVWTQQTPQAKATVVEAVQDMDATGVCRVIHAIDGMYGKRGPVEMRVFLQTVLSASPPVEADPEEVAT